MKIAFNPSTVAALTTPPNNKDITFDLRGRSIFARGVKFYGTDTNTWRDIKINNVSIGSNILDLRNGSNTTLTNTNGVVTINSTWRPVVDNLTSNSTTSSLSANQGRVLKSLIDGKSNSDHNHDGRYVKRSGDTMSGILTIDTTNLGALIIKRNDDTNGASIQFRGKSSVYGYIGFNNSAKDKQFLRWSSDYSKTYTILDTSSTYTSNGKGVINGTTITQVDNATNSTNSTNARKLVNWYSTRPTSLNAQFGDGSLRIFYATSSTTEGKCPDNATVLHLAWDDNGGYDAQLALAHENNNKMYFRSQRSGTWQPWKTLAFTTDIPSSLKNPYALTISLNGTSQGPYDGSAAKNINITPGSIGAAVSNHNHDYLVINAADNKSFNSAYHNFQVLYADGGNGITGKPANVDAFGLFKFRTANGWSGQMLLANAGNLYIRSSEDANMTSTLAWRTILDSSNYSGILDSRYYTESEVNNLLNAKLNRQNLSYGTWNPRGYNLAADYSYNGGDLSISENSGKIYVSINGQFYQNGGQYRVLDTSDVEGLKNADKLDGVHLNGIFTGFSYAQSKLTATIGTVSKTVNVTGSYPSISGVTMNTIASYGNCMGMAELASSNSNVNPNNQTSWHHFINMSHTTESTNMWQTQFAIRAGTTEVWIRSRAGGSISDSSAWAAPWVRLARITDNVASVTKLQTPRSIWGQSFDGTRDVNGSLHNTGTITASAAATYDIGSNSLDYRCGYFRWIGAKSNTNLRLAANDSDNQIVLHTNSNVGIGTTAPTYKLDVSGNIRATGQIVREGHGTSWIQGRNGALLRETSSAGYHALWSLKTTNGSWDFGEYNISGQYNVPILSYITDSNYNSGNNTTTYQIKFPLASGTVALTSNIPNPTNYYWANVKVSTSSSTTTSPTVHTLTATRVCAGHNPGIDNSISCSNWFRSSGNTGWYNTTYQGGWYMSDTSWIRARNDVGIYTNGQIYSPSSIRMGNILLDHIDQINNSANGWLHLNYRNSGNISLCVGGGTVSIGGIDASYKLSVMGNTCTKGFVIRPYYLSNSVSLPIIVPNDGYTYRCLEIGTPAEISCIIADRVDLSNGRGVLLKFNIGYDGQIVLLKDLENYGSGNGHFWVMPSGCKMIRADGSGTLINYNQISNAYDDGRSRFFVYSSRYNAWIEFLCS